MLPTRTRFPNLDGLRFLAAALVVADHLEHSKHNLGLPHNGDLAHWSMLGHLGVLLFFVLSGFLITFLLLEEEQHTGRIRYRAFQMRRVLRIWPLYFMLVLLALFVFPAIDLLGMPGVDPQDVQARWPRKLALYLLFLPTLVPALAGAVPHAIHLWTIGTEQHFYLLWPLLLRFFRRHRLLVIAAVFVGYALVARFLASPAVAGLPGRDLLFLFWDKFRIDSMAVGAFFAVLVFQKSRVLPWLLDRRLFALLVVALPLLMGTGTLNAWFTYRVYAVLLGLLVLNLAVNPLARNALEQPPLRYLGRISYGIYIYHLAVIVLVLNVLAPLGLAKDVLTYPVVFAGTIAVAALSHRWFEGFFQRFRHRFSPY